MSFMLACSQIRELIAIMSPGVELREPRRLPRPDDSSRPFLLANVGARLPSIRKISRGDCFRIYPIWLSKGLAGLVETTPDTALPALQTGSGRIFVRFGKGRRNRGAGQATRTLRSEDPAYRGEVQLHRSYWLDRKS